MLRLVYARVAVCCSILLGTMSPAEGAFPDRDDFHVFILAGQSNMAGRGAVATVDRKPNSKVLMFNKQGTWVPAVDPLHFDKPSIVGVGPGRTFALNYLAEHPGVTVGLVPCAVGGSPIDSWLPGGYHQQTKTHPFDDAMKRCKLASKTGVIKGVLWHQGESDAKPALVGEYSAKLRRVVQLFRDEFGQSLPWFVGQLGRFENVPWSEDKHLIDQEHRELETTQALTYFVPSAGLRHKGDKVHFSASAARELGRRYYEAWKFHEAGGDRLVLAPGAGNPRNSEGDFVTLNDGRILFVYSKFSAGSGDHAEAELVSRVSEDGGVTWTEEDVLVLANEGNMNIMSVSLLRLSDGRLALFYLRKHSLTDCRPIMRVSDNDGASWGDPIEIIPEKDVGYYVVNNDRVVQLSSGRIVIPIALHNTPGQAKPDWAGQVGCYFSDDSGATWRRSSSLQSLTVNGRRTMTQEPGIVELRDGRLMMWVRTDAGFQYQSISEDSGNLWSQLEPMDLASPRSPASIKRIDRTGDLIAVWNDHGFVPTEKRKARTPLSFALSSDDGKTWTQGVPLMNDPEGWYCYSALHFDKGNMLLGTCAGRAAAGEHLSTTVVRRYPIKQLYQQAMVGRLVEHRRIWDKAPHNAFTDLCEYKGNLYCVFREGTGHVSSEGKLRVIRCSDLQTQSASWQSVALISSDLGDLRDAKLTVTPNGQLMLSGAAALPKEATYRHQSLAWFSSDGENWSEEVSIGEKNFWLWRTTWSENVAYSVGYRTGASGERFVRLYTSKNGKRFDVAVPRLFEKGYPNETSLLFQDESAHCLLRRDGSQPSAQLGVARAPFKDWQWKDLEVQLGGPHMIRLPDGRVFAAGRLYRSETPSGAIRSDVRTSLCSLNLETGQITEVLRLPSGGDCSYPGLVWHKGHLWISYYSSHEAGQIKGNPGCRTAIYLAKVRLH